MSAFEHTDAAFTADAPSLSATEPGLGLKGSSIFDSDAVTREQWDPRPPYVDPKGWFFSADTVAELAGKLTANRHQKRSMPSAALQETVAKYNTFVDLVRDPAFGKPSPMYKIQRPPFYAAWLAPLTHDSLAGLRTTQANRRRFRYLN